MSIVSHLAVIGMQFDRCVAVLWDVNYKQRMTTGKAMMTCSMNLVISGIITSLAKVVDPQFGGCIFPARILSTRTTAILIVGGVRFLAVTISIGVTVYVVIKKKRLFSNTVSPLAPAIQISTVGKTATRRIDENPHMFFKLEIPPTSLIPQGRVLANEIYKL